MSLGPSASYLFSWSLEVLTWEILKWDHECKAPEPRQENKCSSFLPQQKVKFYLRWGGTTSWPNDPYINNSYKFSAKHKKQQREGSGDWISTSRLRTVKLWSKWPTHREFLFFCGFTLKARTLTAKPSLWPEELGPQIEGKNMEGKILRNGTLNSLCKLSMSLTNAEPV